MRKIILLFCIVAIIAVSGCTNQTEPTEVNISNNATELELILLDKEGTIPLELCLERNLDDKIISLESKYCGACRIAIPRLQEIEEELQADFIYLDLSKECDLEKLHEFKIMPRYTPTVLIGCDVYIGAYPKEKYNQLIEDFSNN